MPTTARAKRLLLLTGVAVFVLFIAGFVIGGIGSELFGGGDSFLPKPEVHLPAQQVVGSVEHQGENDGTLPDGFVITNTLLSSWIATIVLILLFFFATRRMSLVPRGLQNVMEVVVAALYDFVESVAGPQNARRFFPVIATIFLFVIVNAWLGLLPFYQSVGYIVEEGSGLGVFKDGEITRNLLRSAGTDLNMPLALALVSFVFVEFWGLRLLGRSYIGKFIRLQNLRRGHIFQGLVDVFVGMLETLSELIRIVSFSFRLFGNMLAGEILLVVGAFLAPFVFSIPFYGLELLVGFVQALIFAGLTLVFVVVAVTPHGEEEHS